MIRVLIVDDDKLVRKGLTATMPWEDFDMEVVGEANNGETALEFLSTNQVDLLLTDIAMPVMSGIELMKIVRGRFPRLLTVVLTFHEDFEYIQETLRLGAIDYISKLQLEKENFEDVLGRIYKRVLKEQQSQGTELSKEMKDETFMVDVGYVLVSVEEQQQQQTTHDLIKRKIFSSYKTLIEIDNNILFWIPADTTSYDIHYMDLSKAVSSMNGWMILILDGIMGKNSSYVTSRLKKYSQRDFFYDYGVGNKIILKSISEIGFKPPAILIEEFTLLKKQWLSLQWIYNNVLFEQLLNELKRMRLSEGRIVHFMYDIVNEWNNTYNSIITNKIDLPETFLSWWEVINYLTTLREFTLKSTHKYPYSQEIMGCIVEAVKIVKEEMNQEVYAQEVAKRVNMSRSYFSQAFKEVIGKSFNDYLRFERTEKAKEFLVKSNKPIQLIAELTGYMDQKYFSQVFKEQTGTLPSEYRQNNRKSLNLSEI